MKEIKALKYNEICN